MRHSICRRHPTRKLNSEALLSTTRRPPSPARVLPCCSFAPAGPGCGGGFHQGARSCHCRKGRTHSGASLRPSGRRGSRPRVSEECSRCFVQREVRRISPSPFSLSFFRAALLDTRPPLRKAHSASVSRRIRNRSTPAVSMIISLWPSQKTSVSINHAAGRRHMEHSVTLMVLASKQEGCDRSQPLFLRLFSFSFTRRAFSIEPHSFARRALPGAQNSGSHRSSEC